MHYNGRCTPSIFIPISIQIPARILPMAELIRTALVSRKRSAKIVFSTAITTPSNAINTILITPSKPFRKNAERYPNRFLVDYEILLPDS